MLKDILVHVDSMPSSDDRLEFAVKLAERHGAHLVGLHVKPNPYIPASPDLAGLSDSFFEEQERDIDAHAAAARVKFDAAIRKANIASEWRAVNGFPSEVMRRHSRYADLVIVGQGNPDTNGQSEDLPDGILLTTGRPVLVVPYAMLATSLATNVMIAWDDSAQATRALHDAIQLMDKGAQVTVMAINPDDTGDHGPIPCADVCLHLARHGFQAEARTIVAPDTNVGDILLASTFEQGCDLLVMGAYGHSRMREFVFGGATAQMLESMTLPVLMSH